VPYGSGWKLCPCGGSLKRSDRQRIRKGGQRPEIQGAAFSRGVWGGGNRRVGHAHSFYCMVDTLGVISKKTQKNTTRGSSFFELGCEKRGGGGQVTTISEEKGRET